MFTKILKNPFYITPHGAAMASNAGRKNGTGGHCGARCGGAILRVHVGRF
jgi:hypothetical protein